MTWGFSHFCRATEYFVFTKLGIDRPISLVAGLQVEQDSVLRTAGRARVTVPISGKAGTKMEESLPQPWLCTERECRRVLR